MPIFNSLRYPRMARQNALLDVPARTATVRNSLAQTYGRGDADPKNYLAWMASVGSGEVDSPHWAMPDETAFVPGQGAVGDLAAMSMKKLVKAGLLAGIPGMTVYHGSPYKFSKFLKEKIGTGEGAQAYGHGLYFAENPSVAGEYIRAGRNMGFENWDDPGRLADKAYAQAKGDKVSALKILDDEIAKTKGDTKRNNLYFAKQALERGDHSASLYHVDLPDEKIEKMLDWDKPLSEQGPEVQKAINKMVKTKLPHSGLTLAQKTMESPITSTSLGKDIVDALKMEFRRDEAGLSDYLYKHGIPGIKYLDGGSRSGGKGTRNFVVFNPDDVKILERK